MKIERQGDVARASTVSERPPSNGAAGIVPLALLATVLVPVVASADSNCGPSNGQTVCVTVPGSPLSGDTNIVVTNAPNTGVVIAT
jgi:hypothetical protein